jgi:hypothetical protein
MSNTTTQLKGIGISYFVAAGLMSAFTIRYIIFEIGVLGIRGVLKNKMVMLTSAGAISNAICYLSFPFYYFPLYRLDIGLPNAALQSKSFFISNLCLRDFFAFVVIMTHVALVYLRSKAVLQSYSPKSLLILKVLALLCLLFEVASTVLGGVIVSIVGNGGSVTLLLLIAAPISDTAGVFLTAIDFLSTVSFARYVRSLKDSEKNILVNNLSHVKKTELIAKRGFIICFTSLLGIIFFWINSIALQKVNDGGLTVEYLNIFSQFTWLVIMVLWMRLKMDLDYIAQRSQSKEEVLLETTADKEKKPSAKISMGIKPFSPKYNKMKEQSVQIRETAEQKSNALSVASGRSSQSNSMVSSEHKGLLEKPSNVSSPQP